MADETEVDSQRRFRVDVERDGGSTSLALVGELDLATVERVHARLPEIYDGTRRLVVDLRRLEFIDSTGLRLLMTLHARARRDGFELAIVPGPPAVQSVFDVTGLRSRLPLVDAP